MAEDFQALAIDIGASNGRAVLGRLTAEGRLTLSEVRRFPNAFEEHKGALRWDFDRLSEEVVWSIEDSWDQGLKPNSVGIDTWGVDYVLVTEDGSLVEEPIAYRDRRTEGVMERFFREVMSPQEIYAITGIQFMPINTLYQLASDIFSGSDRLERAHKLLLMADAFAFRLAGSMVSEYTIASTTQMLDARRRNWSEEIVSRLGLRRELLPEIVPPGTKVGTYKSPGKPTREIEVVLSAGHDTAAAVAAVPAKPDAPWAYVSCGTWILVGVEMKTPLLTDEARQAGITNEGGLEGTYRLLKNINGLWLLQECMRMWERRGNSVSIEQVCEAAAGAPQDGPLIDPDHPSFLSPEDMTKAINLFCQNTGQVAPEGVGSTARTIFESLALKTRVVLKKIAGLTEKVPQAVSSRPGSRLVIHLVGGGSRNGVLCQMMASATGCVLVAGPAEATAIGNLLTQAIARGRLRSLAQAREVVQSSFTLAQYEPHDARYWRKRYECFRELLR
jgi:rhamnulokinase